MIIQALAFYFFSGILTLAAIMVITARNPVHSVLFLILSFFTSAGLFVMLGAEFIALLMVIVYVGAVAVLFLFVVMMLDIDFTNLRKGAMQYVPMGLMLGAVLLGELIVIYSSWNFAPGVEANLADPFIGFADAHNTEHLGQVIYTDYIFPFQIAGLILFVAMIGAIVLTLRKRPGVRRQNIEDQQNRKPEDAMDIQKITPRTGA